MNKEIKRLLSDTRLWVEQERVWDDALYATPRNATSQSSQDHTGSVRCHSERSEESRLVKKVQGKILRQSPQTYGGLPQDDNINKTALLQSLYERYKNCTRCPLGNTRLKFVFGVGNPGADALFVGEGPGYEEDHRGEPFVGRAGQLLDRMLESVGLSRKTVYIANIVKCHAMIDPQNPNARGNDRAPTPLEAETCSPILQQQIAIIRPRIIVTLGSPATRVILGNLEGITKLRGRFFPLPAAYFKTQTAGDFFQKEELSDFAGFSAQDIEILTRIQVLPMYHPAALLRNPNLKKDSWADMKLLRDTLLKKA